MAHYGNLPFPLANNGSVPGAFRGDPWFEDGTVILVSGSTPFKVYKGLLARESDFFEELFKAPPTHLFFDRRVEGCEVMRLENSKAKQLGPVLKWIHFGIGKRSPNFDNFHDLAYMFGMTEVYRLNNLRGILIQPILEHYLSRLRIYQEWDGLRSISRPLNPVHALNFARSYEVRIDALVPVIMVDLTLFVSEAELLSAKEPRRSSPYKPGLNSSADGEFCMELWDYHKALARSVGRVLTRFGTGRLFTRRVRCCTFDKFFTHILDVLEKRSYSFVSSVPTQHTHGSRARSNSCGEYDEWFTESHGRYGLELIKAVRTDPERKEFCEKCLSELDEEVMAEYQAWWQGIPRVLGLSGGWEDKALADLRFGEEEVWKWD